MSLGWSEIALLGLLGVVIFGKDLPNVTRNIGRMMHEIRRTLGSLFE